MPTQKPKGHWPAGNRRNPEPPDWARLRSALDEAAKRRQTTLLAKKAGVCRETVMRWRAGTDLPSPGRIKALTAALYAMKLYWTRVVRQD